MPPNDTQPPNDTMPPEDTTPTPRTDWSGIDSAADDTPAHEGEIDIGAETHPGAPAALGGLDARFVRYPGCQQLQLWLPQAQHLGYTDLLIQHADGSVIAQGAVQAHCSGSVSLLWDTLAWPPGDYRVEVRHADGWQHTLALHKRAPGEVAAGDDDLSSDDGEGDLAELARLARLQAAAADSSPTAPIVYRDGFGNVIPDLDLQLRQRAQADIARSFAAAFAATQGCRLEYDGNYREGVVTYIEGDLRIAFNHAMGGGACKFYIELPTPAQWVAATGTALSRRDEIVRTLAETVRAEQASDWHFEIKDDVIRFV